MLKQDLEKAQLGYLGPINSPSKNPTLRLRVIYQSIQPDNLTHPSIPQQIIHPSPWMTLVITLF